MTSNIEVSQEDLKEYALPTQRTVSVHDSAQKQALQILEQRCNFCHIKRNTKRVYTEENMNSFSNDINKQVFVKKQMP